MTVQNEVSQDRIGVASSFNTLSRTLGQTLMISVFGIVMNKSMADGVISHPHTNMNLMDQLINPQTAQKLSSEILPSLREILYNSIHNVLVVALLLVVAAFIVNCFDRKKN